MKTLLVKIKIIKQVVNITHLFFLMCLAGLSDAFAQQVEYALVQDATDPLLFDVVLYPDFTTATSFAVPSGTVTILAPEGTDISAITFSGETPILAGSSNSVTASPFDPFFTIGNGSWNITRTSPQSWVAEDPGLSGGIPRQESDLMGYDVYNAFVSINTLTSVGAGVPQTIDPLMISGQAYDLFQLRVPNDCVADQIRLLINDEPIQQQVFAVGSLNLNHAISIEIDGAPGSNLYVGNRAGEEAIACPIVQPDLSVVKSIVSGDNYDMVGDVISYEIEVTNNGNATLTGPAVIDDPLTGDETCPAGDIASGASITCTASYTVTQADLDNGSVSNTATVTIDGQSDSGSVTANAMQNPSVTVAKSVNSITGGGSTYDAVGDVISYDIVATNNGNVTLTGNASIDDPLTGDETCPAGDIAPGASITCTASYTVTQADLDNGSVSNTATVTIDGQSDSGGVTVSATQNPSVTVAKSVNSITGGGSTYDAVGDVISYDIVATNNGNVTLTGNASINDPLTGDETCPAGDIAPGASITCTASYTVTQADLDNGSVSNTATVTIDSQSDSGSVTANATQNPSVTVAKSVNSITGGGSTYDAVGDVISYDIVATNNGNVTLTGNATIDDPLTGDETCPAGDIAPGASITCTASYTVTQADLDNGSVSNTATVTIDGQSDPGSVTVNATQDPSVTVTKSVSSITGGGSTYAAVGDVISYDIVATNNGNVTLTGNATIDDPLTGDETCPAGDIAPGASITCTASYTVTQADLNNGSVSNTATVTIDGQSDSGSVTVNASAGPSLSIDKTITSGTPYANVGDVINYQFVVTNNGNVLLAGPVTVDDDLTADESCPGSNNGRQ